jgi:hypothetical protein
MHLHADGDDDGDDGDVALRKSVSRPFGKQPQYAVQSRARGFCLHACERASVRAVHEMACVMMGKLPDYLPR